MTSQKIVDTVDYFTISENEESNSCDFCNEAISFDMETREKHLLENHKDKFEKIDHKFTCANCGDYYPIPLEEKWLNQPCQCEGKEWEESFRFFGKMEWLNEWYNEEILSTCNARQNSGSTRLLTTYSGSKDKLFKLDYRIDYSYIGQSHCNLEYWNGKEFTNVANLRMAEFVTLNSDCPDKFHQGKFEKKVHDIIELFVRFI